MKMLIGIAFLGSVLPALCWGRLDLNKDSVVTQWVDGQGNITNVTVDGKICAVRRIFRGPHL
jgi:hypothetical protein